MYYCSEIVVVEGDIPTRFSLLHKGKLEAALNSNCSVLDKISIQQNNAEGKKFMWVLLDKTIRESPSSLTWKSQNHSVILSIPKPQLMEMLKDRKTDYESYCFLRDRISFTRERIKEGECMICPRGNHHQLECPYYHYIPKRDVIVSKHLQRQLDSLKTIQARGDKRRKYRKRIRWARVYKKMQAEEHRVD